MRVPTREHTSRPWRIHEIIDGFRLEDVWEAPTVGAREDFPGVVDLIASYDPAHSESFVVRNLFAARWKLGELFGWDEPGTGVGTRVPTLLDRLPPDLREGPRGPAFEAMPFTSLYLTEDEWAAEAANETMHGIMHVGGVPIGDGTFRAQVAVYVRPNGLFGDAYLAAIKPFRYLLVWPALLRELERTWARGRAKR